MSDTPVTPHFYTDIYPHLAARLDQSEWDGGVSEAHGLLSGLACRGVEVGAFHAHARLLRVSATADMEVFENLLDVILRDLRTDDFSFALLLPPEEDGLSARTEAVAYWCGGFLHGLLHDGEGRLQQASTEVREGVRDIMEVSRLSGAENDEAAARQLFEVEEYLRLAAQMIFDELTAAAHAAPDALTHPSHN